MFIRNMNLLENQVFVAEAVVIFARQHCHHVVVDTHQTKFAII